MRNLLLSYDPNARSFTTEQLVAFVAENRYVLEWLHAFPGTILIKSVQDSMTVKGSLSKFMTNEFFILAEVPLYGTGGNLTFEMWDWFNKGIMSEQQAEQVSKLRIEHAKDRTAGLLSGS